MNDYFIEYKKIRNKLRKYDGVSIVIELANYLREKTHNFLEEMSKHPWICMLLLKWVALDEEFCIKNEKFINRTILIEQLKRLWELSEVNRKVSEYDHYSLFLRNVAFQQFPFEKEPYILSLARQNILFGKLENNHSFRTKYKQEIGIDIDEAIILAIPLFDFFCTKNHAVGKIDLYGDMLPVFGSKSKIFIDSISCDRDALHNFLKTNDRVGRRPEEYFELSPLIHFPLFRFSDRYICVSSQLMGRSLESHFYNKLKSFGPEWFMNKFGSIFQRYVDEGLIYALAPYRKEKEIQSILNYNGKVTDFFISDDNTGILMDAKGVELSYYGQVTHLADVIKDKTESSIIKAIEQSFSVVERLEKNDVQDSILTKKQNYFLLVVTYKEMYLGNGNNFYEIIAKNKLDSIASKYNVIDRLPYSHMYFITIEEFEVLITLMKNGISISKILFDAVVNDSDPQTKKFDFIQHLSAYATVENVPEFLRSEWLSIIDKTINAMEKNSST